ncbi:MAG: V-type ATPase 116kDa subunit family protein [Nitrososphaerota archaeon]
MVVERLLKATVIAPSSRAHDLLKSLHRFGEFHPIARGDQKIAGRLEPLYEKARRIYLELEAAARELEVEAGGGVIEVLLKGEPEPESLSVGDVEELLEMLSSRAQPILSELKRLDDELEALRPRIEKLERERARLSIHVQLGIDFSPISRLKSLYAVAFIASIRDVEEIAKSLDDAAIALKTLERGSALLLVIAKPIHREKIERIIRSFNLMPIEVRAEEPPDKLAETLREVEGELARLRAEVEALNGRKGRIRYERGREILSLRSLAQGIIEAIQRMRGETGKLFVLEGYVSESLSGELVREVGRVAYVHLSTTKYHHDSEEKPPTKLRNNWITESFKPVTLIQGPPSYYEVDPTPLVSIFLSIFYGIMFADMGQGLVLALLGLILSVRARSALRLWGRLIMILGVSSTVAGFLIQEAFGFKLSPVTGMKPILELVEHHGESAIISTDAVVKLFTFAPLLGFIHVSIGLLISAYILAKHGELGEAVFSKAASLGMYVSGLLFALAFITTRGFETLLTNTQPVPIIGIPANQAGTIGIIGILLSMVLLVGGRIVGSFTGLIPGGSILGHIGTGLLEILENIIHFMSNTLSYLRISILMIIHVALMLLINSAWEALGLASLGILVIGNIGVMGLEGLLVFIQALRLHLYEFFSKFFSGEGILFKPLTLNSERIKIVFRE